MMTAKMVFNSGPPPHIGWWLASVSGRTDTWRWWDGRVWSYGYRDTDTEHLLRAANEAPQMLPTDSMRVCDLDGRYTSQIKWTHYWPENARVPRVDPSLPGSNGVVRAINLTAYTNLSAVSRASWAQIAHLLHEKALARAAVDNVTGSTLTVRKMKVGVR